MSVLSAKSGTKTLCFGTVERRVHAEMDTTKHRQRRVYSARARFQCAGDLKRECMPESQKTNSGLLYSA